MIPFGVYGSGKEVHKRDLRGPTGLRKGSVEVLSYQSCLCQGTGVQGCESRARFRLWDVTFSVLAFRRFFGSRISTETKTYLSAGFHPKL